MAMYWIVTLPLSLLLVGYCVVLFKRIGDWIFIAVSTLISGLTVISTLTMLSQDRRFLGLTWEVWLFSYFALVALLVIYYGFSALWPFPSFLNLRLSQAYAKVLELHEQGEIRRASQAARQLITVFPGRAEVRYLMGKLLSEQGKYKKAIRQLEIARKLAPESTWTLLELGSALQMLGRYQEAIHLFQQVLALDPENTYALNLLSDCQEKLQDVSSEVEG